MTDAVMDPKVSPMMVQWNACKQVAGESVLLFRMGDFYESFYDDAVLIARELGLTLTKRQDIPMCGVPHHTCEAYIDKLVSKGYRVAVAEQMEDPRLAKGLVKREVVRVVTPGTLINSSLLSDKSNNFVVSLARVGAIFGLAILDLTTADFKVIEFDKEGDLLNELYRQQPAEILVSPRFKEKHTHMLDELRKNHEFLLSTHDEWRFEHQMAHDFMTGHLEVLTLDGFGLKGMVAAINAAGGLLNYLQDSLCLPIGHVKEVQVYTTSQYMAIDRATQRHLELTESLSDGSRRNTLLNILDQTCTPMGARLIRHWVKQPLLQVEEIVKRQDAVQAFHKDSRLLEDIIKELEVIRDLERLITKVSAGYASPRDIVALKNSLEPIPRLKNLLQSLAHLSPMIAVEEAKLESLPEMTQLIARAVVDEPPVRLSDGKIFRDGYCKELDELREISRDSKAWLVRYQTELKETTGIKTLKVSFNKMFGYYIEVSKGQADKMPETFQRRQTLVNAERFITPELKEYENKVLHAEERISSIEVELFNALKLEVAKYSDFVQRTAHALARVDALQGLATAARKYDYARPVVNDGSLLHIVSGRHPVIEASHTAGERFVANDTYLNGDDQRMFLITGPNMAGKSTYIRQVALITIMAQIGAFVPVASAQIGIVDKVFSRIGASDDLSRGQSTFMVEMTETANILNNATSRSLVILDEIGRGTSTYDGISIAWAVAEFLLITEGKMAKTLFATHYWELTKLEKVPGAINYNVAVHESEDSIVFLRKIVRGGTDKSYGIHVGRLAGLPSIVIARAKEILVHLEENANRKNAFEPAAIKRTIPKQKSKVSENMQLTFFS
ncbi:MAG: DNA mismatch repair protein MutS [Parachlamydiaceae bacterium]|nr:DNA mismatch repair protein MutS [Parachlamydiaceae bacterium]